ncbi:hypothetical protein HDG33_004377 [Paraburkholderia sp. Cpub6]|nr:hypothetical protein [Paraburkholderia sp. Cpub6]
MPTLHGQARHGHSRYARVAKLGLVRIPLSVRLPNICPHAFGATVSSEG